MNGADTVTNEDGSPAPAEEHTQAVRALEVEFGELFLHMHQLYVDQARRVHPALLPGGYKVFTMIARRGPVTASALSECMYADKAHVSRTVKFLEELGLVTRTADPSDGRSSLLSLTADGEDRLAAARDPHANPLAHVLDDWSVADIRSLSALLHTLTVGATAH